MLPDLERLIRLQSLRNAADDARRCLAKIPAQLDAFDANLAEHRKALDDARQRFEDNQTARRNLEKQVAAVQSRLDNKKDQLMNVKTNEDYLVIQKEITAAQDNVQSSEERILQSMLDGDALDGAVKNSEHSLVAAEAGIESDRCEIEKERVKFEAAAKKASDAAEVLTREIEGVALALFEQIAEKRNGVAVVEAKNNLCSSCHVRLRPQVFNDIRRNNKLIQCESCGRILHFLTSGNLTLADSA